jgi:hypothetical protein
MMCGTSSLLYHVSYDKNPTQRNGRCACSIKERDSSSPDPGMGDCEMDADNGGLHTQIRTLLY